MSNNIITDADLALLRSLAATEVESGLSYGTVRDFAQGAELFPKLLNYNGDIKDSQRYWMLKAILSTQPAGATLLEIGAGEPIVADILGRLGYRVIVVDPYEGAGNGPTELDHFKRSYQNVEYIVDWFSCDIDGVKANSVACCYSISVIEHIPLEKLKVVSDAIAYFTLPEGSSIHAVDVVSLGMGAEYHKEMFLKFSELLGHDKGQAVVALEKAAKDPDTYYLSAEAHNRWRGTVPYDEFPMRRVQSMQIVGFGTRKHILLPSDVSQAQNSESHSSNVKSDLQQSIASIRDLHSIVSRYDQTGHRCLKQAVDAIKQNAVLDPHFPVRLFNGSVMNVNVREEVGSILFEFSAYEFGLTKFFIDFLSRGDVFFDIGAHYGYFSVLASNLVGPKGSVHSFEPTPFVAGRLRANVLHLGNVEVHQTAIGNKDGHLEFNDYGPDFSAFNSAYSARLPDRKLVPLQRVTVPVSRLDTFCATAGVRPALVKIDTESSEMLVLEGMGGLINEARALVVELGDFDDLNAIGVPRSAEILEYVRRRGYKLFLPTDDGLREHKISSDKYDYCNVVCLRDDAVSFLQEHRASS